MNDFTFDIPQVTAGSAIIYARVSTGRQAARDLSIPDQFHQLRDFCKSQGMEIAAEFQDAYTGREMDRPGIAALQEYLATNPGKVQFVVAHSFSRMARDLFQYELMKRDFAKVGVKIISITQPVENSDDGNLLRQIINAFDEHSSRETAKHVSRSMKENARQGFWNGGVAPFGFRACDAGVRGDKIKKKLELEPVEAEDVRLIYRLYLEGDGKSGPMGVKKVAHWLNKKGHSRRKGLWTNGLVHRVLTDRLYVGERLFKKDQSNAEKIVISVPPILDEASFERAQLRLRRHHPMKTAPRVVNSPILLTGTAFCGHCGGGMILRTGKSGKYRYYTCSNQTRKGKTVCTGQSVPMGELDEVVTQTIMQAV